MDEKMCLENMIRKLDTVDNEKLQEIGLNYSHTFGYDLFVYKDSNKKLYGFHKYPESMELFMTAEPNHSYPKETGGTYK